MPKLKPNTAEDYRSKISKHLIPFFGDRRLNEITTADIQHFYTAKTNYAHSTVHCMGIILHQLFDSAKEDGFYQGMNPTESKRLTMSTKKKEREALTMDEVQEIIGNLDKLDPESKLLVMVLLHTGGRRGEALGLRWEDIDFERRTIHLNRDIDFVSNQPVIDDKMKSKAAHRYIPLDDTLYTLLQSIREREGFIFNRDGKPWTERIYMRRWNKIRRVICSKDITAHMIRHTYATTLIGNHTDVKTVSALLGHADTQTTLNIYTHPITQNLQNAGVLLDSIYQQKPTKIADKIA